MYLYNDVIAKAITRVLTPFLSSINPSHVIKLPNPGDKKYKHG